MYSVERVRVPVAHSPLTAVSSQPPSIRCPTPSQEAGNALVTPLTLRVSMGGGDRRLASSLPHGIYCEKKIDTNFTVVLHDNMNITGINRKNRTKWQYPSIRTAHRRVLCPIKSPEPQAGLSQEEAMVIEKKFESSDSDFEYDLKAPELFNQTDLNDLIRDLGLSEQINRF
ncbi:hypothetical protein EVAR_59210_1 [Eumeta japonica]|uniref:Uncharacterized protein n=1 Tax=Eumeta variegata TaxID=151549 RepID=A0A4C1YSV9_EUMVA|nr:hypothetical protein EVAR_59210_1 [Eumeta japonica]